MIFSFDFFRGGVHSDILLEWPVGKLLVQPRDDLNTPADLVMI